MSGINNIMPALILGVVSLAVFGLIPLYSRLSRLETQMERLVSDVSNLAKAIRGLRAKR